MSATVIISYQAKADMIDAALEFLSNLQVQLQEAGCQKVSLLQNQEQRHRIFEVELWDSAEAHKQFVKRATASGALVPFDKLLRVPFKVYYFDNVRNSPA